MTKRFLPYLLLLLSVLPAVEIAAAEPQVESILSPTEGSVQDVFRLEITVSGENISEIDGPHFEPNDRFRIEAAGTSRQHRMVNGKYSASLTNIYRLIPDRRLQPGLYRVGGGSVSVSGKQFTLPYKELRLQQSAAANQARSAPGEIGFVHIVDNYAPYVGQQITYKAEIAGSSNFQGGQLENFELPGFWREQITGEEPRTRNTAGTTIHTFVEAIFPLKAGVLEIPSRTLQARVTEPTVSRRRRGWGGLSDPLLNNFIFSRSFQTRNVALHTDPITIRARPLPAPPIDAPYLPVGKLKVIAKADKSEIKLGESITFAVRFSGTANLRPLELQFSSDETKNFTRYDEKPELNTEILGDKLLFTKTFQMALVPLKEGTFDLPRIKLPVFDPDTEQYEILDSGKRTIKVLPGEGQEELLVSGADPSALGAVSSPAGPPETEEPQLLAEDIRPQHIGAALYRAPLVLPGGITKLLLLLIPLLAFGGRYFLRQKLAGNELHIQRKKAAFSTASQSIREAEAEPATAQRAVLLRSAVLQYLSDRFGVPTESLTAGEAGSLLSEFTDASLSRRLEEFLYELERVIYSGGAQGEIVPLLASGKELVSRIEAHLNEVES